MRHVARFAPLARVGAPCPRSSHGVSALNSRVYVIGGEAVARQPIDMTVHELHAPEHAPAHSSAAEIPNEMLLGLPGDNTHANYAEANRALYRQTLVPLAARTAQALAGWLEPAFGAIDLEPDLDRIEALAGERDLVVALQLFDAPAGGADRLDWASGCAFAAAVVPDWLARLPGAKAGSARAPSPGARGGRAPAEAPPSVDADPRAGGAAAESNDARGRGGPRRSRPKSQ